MVVTMLAQTETETVYATRGKPFEMTGFVLGYEGGNCSAPNFHYLLDSTDHRNKIWLCASGSNELALRQAMLSRGIYCVTGTFLETAERPYLEVETVRWY